MSDAGAGGILQITDVTRSFGDVKAVDRLSVNIERGEFITLLGPSGCGKTTALRLIAGFERPEEGRISFEGEEVTSWSPQRRGFGMVFQSYALFPHLDVFENVAFGLRARKLDAAEISTRVHSALEIVDLGRHGGRAVQALSGGQQQRVALARALAIEPPLLLLDEPLSNLDQALRVQTRNDLRRLVKDLGITALFVTHDQEEAFDLSDRIAVMNAGRIHQIGSPRQLYEEPGDRFVAGFVGRANVISARLVEEGVRLTERVVWPLPPDRPDVADAAGLGSGRRCKLLVRPEQLRFVEAPDSTVSPTPLVGVVRDRRFRGGSVLYQVELEGMASDDRGIPPGQSEKATVEVVASTEGPSIGSQASIAPVQGARLHVFPLEPAT